MQLYFTNYSCFFFYLFQQQKSRLNQEHFNVLTVRQHSASNRRLSSAHSGVVNRSQTPKMDTNQLNAENVNAIPTDEKPKNDNVNVDISEKDENTVATMLANELIASPNFLRIPLKPIEKLSNDYPSNEKP